MKSLALAPAQETGPLPSRIVTRKSEDALHRCPLGVNRDADQRLDLRCAENAEVGFCVRRHR